MAENRKSGNNRLDLPNKGKAYFDQAFGINKNQIPIVTRGWNSYVLTIGEDNRLSLTTGVSGSGGTVGDRITTGSITAAVNIGANTFRVQSGSSTFLYVSSSGNIGIGTITPSSTLHISGTFRTQLSTAIQAQVLGVDSNGNVTIFNTSSITTAGGGSLTGAGSANYIPLWTGTSTIATSAIYQSGNNIGIGTITPTNTFQVNGGITATSITASIISASNSITGSLFGTASWAQSASNAINARTASFLPVGTYQITSSWAQSASNAINAQTASFVNITSTNVFVQGGNSFGTTALLGTNDNQNLQFETNGSVRMTISNSGNVGINTTTPTALLDINGNTIIRGALTASIISASSWISGSDLRVANSTTIGTTLGVTGVSTFANNLNSPTFFSGFAGSGWKLDSSNLYSLELDNLTVRGTMKVYELLISQIRATNGSIFVSNTGKVETATDLGNNTYYLTFDTGSQYGHSFQVGDIIRAQRFNITASTVYQCNLIVAGVPSTQALTASFNGAYGTSSYGFGIYGAGVTAITAPTGGMEFVRLGNISNFDRQGTVYLTADDNNAPFIDVKDGVTTHAGFNNVNTTKVRIGKLDGVISPLFGQLSGYGMWASGSAYLEGTINATAGKIGGFAITQDAITGSGFFLSGAATPTGFFISSSNFNVKGNGTITASAGLIGGFNTTATEIKTTGSITAIDNDTRTSITYPNLSLNNNGDITGSSLVIRTLIPSASTQVSYKLVDTATGVADFKNIGRPILTQLGSTWSSVGYTTIQEAWLTTYESPPCYLLPGENLLLITMQFYGNVGTGSTHYNSNTKAKHNARILVAIASGSTNPQLIGTGSYDGQAGRSSVPSAPTWWSAGLTPPYYPGNTSYLNNWITGSDPASYTVWQLSPTGFTTQNIAPSGGISTIVSPTSSLGIAIIPTGSRGQYVKFFLQAYISQSSFQGMSAYTTISNVTLTTARGYTAASVGGGTNVYDPASNYALSG
jgi:hypothetical protein